MNQKKMEKIIRRRRRAQGIGALAGTLTTFAILGALFGGDMKDEAKQIAAEAKEKIPEEAKKLASEAKTKLGLE